MPLLFHTEDTMLTRIAIFAAAALLWCAPAQDLSPRITEKIEAALKKSGAPSVSVAVVQDGKIAFAKAFGKADLENGRPADTNTRYAVGSISKQFTAAALLLLQEQDKLSLDDKVSKYFPNLTRAGEITIRQLLSHTSGYEDYAPQDYIIPDWTRATTPAAILDTWANKPLNFDPGTKWQYSNTNYVLAGEIFEKVSGRKLVDFLTEKIFAPLEMRSAGDWPPANPADALAYTRYAIGPPRLAKREASGWYFAAGELCMTPSDVARWDIAILQKKILSARSYEEFTREMRLANGNYTHYSLGLTVGEFNGIPTLQHSGEVSGFISYNAVFPTRNAAVVVLSNQDGVNLVTPSRTPDRDCWSSCRTSRRSRRRIPGRCRRSSKTCRREGSRGRSSPAMPTLTSARPRYKDCKASLAPLGKLKTVAGTSENLRGGMTHRSYRAEFEKKTVILNIYITRDGKFEQFMVEDQI